MTPFTTVWWKELRNSQFQTKWKCRIETALPVWVLALSVAVVAISAGLFVGAPVNDLRGFPLDDAWIFQVVARNLAETGVWGFLPGSPSSGATSILWTLVLSANYRFLGFEPVMVTWAVNLMLLGGIATCFFYLLLDDLDVPMNAALLATASTLLGNYVWLSASGMESLLLAFFSILAVFLWRRSSQWTGVVCALAVLTRPEAVGLPFVLVAAGVIARRDFRIRGLVILYAPVVLAVIVSAYLSWTTSGGILPTTLEGRRWLYGFKGPSFQLVWKFTKDWAITLVVYAFGWPQWLVLVVPVIVLIGGLIALRHFLGLATLSAWAFAIDALYAVLLPSQGHGGRYQPLNLFLAPGLAALGLAEIARWLVRDPRARRALLPGSAIAIALACLPSLWTWRDVTVAGIDHIERAHVTMAKWIRHEVPPETPVAAFDIGAMGYFSGHPVVDLGGLVERSYVPYLVSGRVPEYLRERRISLVVIPSAYISGGGPDLGRVLRIVGNRTLFILPIKETGSAPEIWWKGFDATSHSSPRLVTYRIWWPTR